MVLFILHKILVVNISVFFLSNETYSLTQTVIVDQSSKKYIKEYLIIVVKN